MKTTNSTFQSSTHSIWQRFGFTAVTYKAEQLCAALAAHKTKPKCKTTIAKSLQTPPALHSDDLVDILQYYERLNKDETC